jgi:hypothetical protein
MSREAFRQPYPEDNLSLAELEVRIPRAEQDYARLRAANRVLRNPKVGDETKIARLVNECRIHPHDAPDLLKPNRTGQLGFRLAGYTAAIHRMKQRRIMLEEERRRPSIAFTFAGGRVEDSAEHGRISVFLSPAHQPETVHTLLARGFVFAPTRQCYCRWRGEAARSVVAQLTGTEWPPNTAAALRPATRVVAETNTRRTGVTT